MTSEQHLCVPLRSFVSVCVHVTIQTAPIPSIATKYVWKQEVFLRAGRLMRERFQFLG